MWRRSATLLASQALRTGLRQESHVFGAASPPCFSLPSLFSSTATFGAPKEAITTLPSLAVALPSILPPKFSLGQYNRSRSRGLSSIPEEAPAAPPPPTPRQGHRLACVITPQTLPVQNVRVEATYVGSGINIYDLMARPEFQGHYKRLHKETVILALSDAHINESAEAEGMPLEPYLVATSYGSAVFFNVGSSAKEKWMGVLQSVATEPVSGEKKYNEEYIVALVPELPAWSQLEPECIRLQTLDLRNMQVISQVLAQSVALDYYSAHVERTLETFCSMNFEMAESASIAGVDKQVLLRLVAENNIVMTEIISKLGVNERYDIAWKYVQYGKIWEFLRAELEMEPRFKILDMKLLWIQDNLKYFLEILQARKSDSLEWTIIILIAAEIALSLYELGSRVG